MSALERIKDAAVLNAHSGRSDGRTLLADLAVDKVERAAFAFGFGVYKGYRYKSSMFGDSYVGHDLVAGTAAIIGSALLNWRGKASAFAPHLERFGDAGLMSWANSMGAAVGAYKAGRVTFKGLGTTEVGALPAASGGAYLTAEEIARYSAVR